MVVRIATISGSADTTEHGLLVYAVLRDELSRSENVVVSFEGIQTATSSFVNVAFVELLNYMSFSDIKRRLRITNTTSQINHMIRTRMEREASNFALSA